MIKWSTTKLFSLSFQKKQRKKLEIGNKANI